MKIIDYSVLASKSYIVRYNLGKDKLVVVFRDNDEFFEICKQNNDVNRLIFQQKNNQKYTLYDVEFYSFDVENRERHMFGEYLNKSITYKINKISEIDSKHYSNKYKIYKFLNDNCIYQLKEEQL